MNRDEILNAIRRIAAANGGKAPGSQRVQTETGLTKSNWYPDLWQRWGDAVRDAGLEGNTLCKAFDPNTLVRKYVDLALELGHFPIEGDLRIKHSRDKSFPNHGALGGLGNKARRIEKVREYCLEHPGHESVISMCEQASKQAKVSVRRSDDREPPAESTSGYVYLFRHGSRPEYKIGRTTNVLRREGEVRVELPEKLEPIHYVRTDDPGGVEAYWHRRFSAKRKEGEWFALDAADVRAFKRWKKIW